MADLITVTFFSILAAGFLVGIVVGLTGMGGGALMTPALIFLGVGDAATVVTAATRWGPISAIGTEPMISHMARVRLGEPFLACTAAPPDL